MVWGRSGGGESSWLSPEGVLLFVCVMGLRHPFVVPAAPPASLVQPCYNRVLPAVWDCASRLAGSS